MRTFALWLTLSLALAPLAGASKAVRPAAPRVAGPAAAALPESGTPWTLRDGVRYVVPHDRWLIVTDAGQSAGLSVRTGIDANLHFLASGAALLDCVSESRYGVACPPGSTVVAQANAGVRGFLTQEALEKNGPPPGLVFAKHALLNPKHSPRAHVTTVPAGHRLHLTGAGARADSPLRLAIDGTDVAELQGGCLTLSRVVEAGSVVELVTEGASGPFLGAVFGYYEALPEARSALATK